jgi:hypothetical protein
VDHRPDETSPVPPSTFTTSRPPYAGEFFGAASPGSSHLPWPSLSLKSSALPCPPSGANISTLQGSLLMLRAAVLYSLLRRLQRFSTISLPIALVACYVASWQLPRLDFRQLADDSLSGHTSEGSCGHTSQHQITTNLGSKCDKISRHLHIWVLARTSRHIWGYPPDGFAATSNLVVL